MDAEKNPEDSGEPYERGRWMRHWMKHTAIVPKGFLRYQLLKFLNEKPMSGSEIMSELENQTSGYWKPSPGSIYPLLSWLQDKGYIKEADQKEPGIRRYTLTEQGKGFLGNEAKSREEIDKRLKHFGPTPGFFGPMWFGYDREDAKEFRQSRKGLFQSCTRPVPRTKERVLAGSNRGSQKVAGGSHETNSGHNNEATGLSKNCGSSQLRFQRISWPRRSTQVAAILKQGQGTN